MLMRVSCICASHCRCGHWSPRSAANAQRNNIRPVPSPSSCRSRRAGRPTFSRVILGQHMSQTLGQQIVVENVTGAGGSIGAARVAKAAPDGYTMVMGNLGTHAAASGSTRIYPTIRATISSR